MNEEKFAYVYVTFIPGCANHLTSFIPWHEPPLSKVMLAYVIILVGEFCIAYEYRKPDPEGGTAERDGATIVEEESAVFCVGELVYTKSTATTAIRNTMTGIGAPVPFPTLPPVS